MALAVGSNTGTFMVKQCNVEVVHVGLDLIPVIGPVTDLAAVSVGC